MTNEEKKAIEELEEFIEDDEIENISVFTAKKIKNIIDNQQKEIEREEQYIDFYKDLCKKQQEKLEEWKRERSKRSWVHIKENGEVEPLFYISKNKIREIFQFYIERDSLFNDDPHKMAVIRLKDVLQELLGEDK